MSAPPAPLDRRTPLGYWTATLLATASTFVTRNNAYLIDIIRIPIYPLLYFAIWQVTYRVAGQASVDGVDPVGFLLVGMVGLITWSSTIWASGYALEYERAGGTIAALFLTPASRTAVILGYGLGSLVWLLPSYLVVALLGAASGARLTTAGLLPPLVALLALAAASLAVGYTCASLFILSRRANLLANALQLPIYLLAGFIVPRAALPDWLRPLSDALPVSHAIDALRATCLAGADLDAIAPALALTGLTSFAFGLIGWLSLRGVEDAARRSGTLDLY